MAVTCSPLPWRLVAGKGTLSSVTATLGVSDSNYYAWLKAGIRPPPAAQRGERKNHYGSRCRLGTEAAAIL